MKNQAIFRMTFEFLMELLKGGYKNTTIKGIPIDVELVYWFVSNDSRTLSVVLEHESFDAVPEGAPYSQLCPLITSFDIGTEVEPGWYNDPNEVPY